MMNSLASLSLAKYARLLPRVFPGCALLELLGNRGESLWQWPAGPVSAPDDAANEELVAWADFGAGIQRRTIAGGKTQFRGTLMTRDRNGVGWLVVTYDTSVAVPMDTAPDPLRRAFADATTFLQEEMELQSECNQLAVELTERYEELNLVYSTDDSVERFEEGQEALAQLVHNCADYLDVGMAALVCRDRNLDLHEVNRNETPADPDGLLELLRQDVYNRVESQVSPVVLNELDEVERRRLLGEREDNLLAYPILDDHGNAIGMLAVAARHDLHTFSNGDRNLLEVMAKKASRIIHTHHDSLTGLINRSGFESALVSAISSTRNTNIEHCVLHVDIDQLHIVNDLLGYQEGDALIRRVARVLRHRLRESDYLARLGSDEFGILLSRCSMAQGYEIAGKINGAIRELEVISANRQLQVTASIGVALLTRETEGIVSLLASAEIACKTAKENGRNCIQMYEEDNTKLVRRSEEIEWLGRVQTALRDDAFEIYCQPVVPLVDSSRASHFEILLRMKGEDDEILSPAIFMPAAERYQMMPMVDRWVIRNTFRLLGRKWPEISAARPVFCINLSGQSLTNTGFLAFIVDELNSNNVPATNVCFEITETAAISNIEDAVSLMNALRQIGCRFSLDDFGAGLSSFGYLKMLPVDYLKIDGSFVREITNDKVSLSMVKAMCGIGRTMGLSIVAEYVTDKKTAQLLRSIKVDFAQGYGVGKPVPIVETIAYLQSRQKSAQA